MAILVHALDDLAAGSILNALAGDFELALAVGGYTPKLRIAQAPAIVVWSAAAAEHAEAIYALVSRATCCIVLKTDQTPWRGPAPASEQLWTGQASAYRVRATLNATPAPEKREGALRGLRRGLAGVLALAGLVAPVAVVAQQALAAEPTSATSSQAGIAGRGHEADVIVLTEVARDQGFVAVPIAAAVQTMVLSEALERGRDDGASAREAAWQAAFMRDPVGAPSQAAPKSAAIQPYTLLFPPQALS